MLLVAPSILAQPICRDPDDDIVLGTAVAGKVVIITGGKGLLILRQVGIDIIRPAEFSVYEATRQ
jgi:predicted nucleic acid-binding protein